MQLSEQAASAAEGAGAATKGAQAGFDARARLLCALLLALGVALSTTLLPALCWLAVALTAVALARPGWHALRGPFLSVTVFLLAVWSTLPLSLPLPEALPLATLMSAKAYAALFFTLALCHGLSLPETASALRALRVPPALVTLFLLVCRHIHTLRREWSTSLHALRLRAPHPRPRQALYLYACLLGSVLVRSADTAHGLRLALLCKAGHPHQCLHGRLHWTWKDTTLCLSALLLTLSLTFMPSGGILATTLTR